MIIIQTIYNFTVFNFNSRIFKISLATVINLQFLFLKVNNTKLLKCSAKITNHCQRK